MGRFFAPTDRDIHPENIVIITSGAASEENNVNKEAPTEKSDEPIFILITQCLQNSFFLAEEDRLCLPQDVVEQMLVGSDENHLPDQRSDLTNRSYRQVRVRRRSRRLPEVTFPVKPVNRRVFDPQLVKVGPLYRFFEIVLNEKWRGADSNLHVIHIRDWHESSESYDRERRLYGSHCEANTWEAEPLEGFDEFLRPWPDAPNAPDVPDAPPPIQQTKAGFLNPQQNHTTYYEVRSNTLFDLRNDTSDTRPECSNLREILDHLINGAESTQRVYVVVIGVYTDIKIMTLLTGLRTLYRIDNLVVSDVLTASTTLERHLTGLDFADKVLGCEIIHSLNDLVSVLAHRRDKARRTVPPDDPIPADVILNHADFRNYKNYFLDKQSVLAFQDNRLHEYLTLTSRRSMDMFRWFAWVNKGLTFFGFLMLFLTLYAVVAHLQSPKTTPLETPLLLGGLSIAQFLVMFFRRPNQDIQQNLSNLVRLRNYLETYSTITALLRHHFTRPEYLASTATSALPSRKRSARAQLRGETAPADDIMSIVEQQMKILNEVAAALAENFKDINFEIRGADPTASPDPAKPKTPPDGKASVP